MFIKRVVTDLIISAVVLTVFILNCGLTINNVDGTSSSFNSALEDDFQFLFKWPGEASSLEHDLKEIARKKIEVLDIQSSRNEKYRCTIPFIVSDSIDELSDGSKQDSNLENKEPINTSSLLDNIYSRKLCSYRIESYWIYELCHGQFIKQYHETKNSGKRLVTNEYFLGYYDANKQEPNYLKKNDNEMIPNVHWRNLGSQKVPMFAVKYTDGTSCDILGNVPRESTVFYACDEYGNDNIVGFEEISSCVYELVVVTKWICSHSAYRIPEKTYESISCYSVDDSPIKPTELTEIENEQATSRGEGNKIKMTDQHGGTFIIHYRTIDDEDASDDEFNENVPVQASAPQDAQTSQQQNQQQQQQQPQHHPPYHQPTINDEAQKEMINAFVSGVQCLHGGVGWWKYEVCLGKHVFQYHEDEKTKKRTNILLGSWNIERHLNWLSKNPQKRPIPLTKERTSVSQMYTNGDFCDLSAKHRFVEVKFKCIRSKDNRPASSSHAISMYLLEPHTCEYVLTIESPWLCGYVESLDFNALQGIQQQPQHFTTPPPPPPTPQPSRHDVP